MATVGLNCEQHAGSIGGDVTLSGLTTISGLLTNKGGQAGWCPIPLSLVAKPDPNFGFRINGNPQGGTFSKDATIMTALRIR